MARAERPEHAQRPGEPSPVGSSSPIPLYYQIANILQSCIYSGQYAPGALLGTEKELAAEFRVSRVTIQKALDALHAQGIIDRQRARGTFVAQGVRPHAPVELHGFLDDLIIRGETGHTLTADFDEVCATRLVAERLDIEVGEIVTRMRRLRAPRPDADPTTWVVNYLPRDVAEAIQIETLPKISVVQLIDAVPGLELAHGHQVISAESADAETANRLRIPVGSPLLLVERVLLTSTGRAVDFAMFHSLGRSQSVRLSRVRRRPLVR